MPDNTPDNTPDNNKSNQLRDLKKIIIDLTRDLLNTFPELAHTLNVNLLDILDGSDDINKIAIKSVFEHCKNTFPERFFDILYQNNKMFEDETINVEFLPGIDFRPLWKENISNKTRETIWKYLQLILFTTVSDISNGESFGDAAKLFEAIDENEFRAKLEDTINKMQGMFEENNANDNANVNGEEKQSPGINLEDLPDPNTIHERVAGMMNGKLGNLAREIAEETAHDLNMDMENASSINDVFQKLFKNPTKLLGLIKNVGGKLDEKIKSGDIKESELLAEATDIVNKMKDMPGMGNLQSMLGKMGMGGGKINTSAMQSHLNRNMKLAKQKERMRTKIDEKQNAKQFIDNDVLKAKQDASLKAAEELLKSEGYDCDGIEKLVFRTGETYEKSVKQTENNKKNKKKKNKQNK